MQSTGTPYARPTPGTECQAARLASEFQKHKPQLLRLAAPLQPSAAPQAFVRSCASGSALAFLSLLAATTVSAGGIPSTPLMQLQLIRLHAGTTLAGELATYRANVTGIGTPPRGRVRFSSGERSAGPLTEHCTVALADSGSDTSSADCELELAGNADSSDPSTRFIVAHYLPGPFGSGETPYAATIAQRPVLVSKRQLQVNWAGLPPTQVPLATTQDFRVAISGDPRALRVLPTALASITIGMARGSVVAAACGPSTLVLPSTGGEQRELSCSTRVPLTLEPLALAFAFEQQAAPAAYYALPQPLPFSTRALRSQIALQLVTADPLAGGPDLQFDVGCTVEEPRAEVDHSLAILTVEDDLGTRCEHLVNYGASLRRCQMPAAAGLRQYVARCRRLGDDGEPTQAAITRSQVESSRLVRAQRTVTALLLDSSRPVRAGVPVRVEIAVETELPRATLPGNARVSIDGAACTAASWTWSRQAPNLFTSNCSVVPPRAGQQQLRADLLPTSSDVATSADQRLVFVMPAAEPRIFADGFESP